MSNKNKGIEAALRDKGGVEVKTSNLSGLAKILANNTELNRNMHLEAFTSAYYKLTGIPPTDAVLCEIKIGDNSTIYFFDTKDNLFEEVTKALSLTVEEELNGTSGD